MNLKTSSQLKAKYRAVAVLLLLSFLSIAACAQQEADVTGNAIMKGNVVINTAGPGDSVNYVINGEKSTKKAFEALTDKDIFSIAVFPAKEVGTFFGKADGKHDVLCATTSGSEAGKKFKEKVDKEFGDVAVLAGVNTAPFFASDESGVTSPLGQTVTLARPAGDGELSKLTTAMSYYSNQDGPQVLTSFNAESGIRDFSDKMIIIDGKKSTPEDLKKLSFFDIDRMTLKTDEETEQLYGDKAKNGIVFIVTKKK